jgi:hypothetical protein
MLLALEWCAVPVFKDLAQRLEVVLLEAIELNDF